MELYSQVYINKAIDEIISPAFAVTKQYLEVNEIEFLEGKPKVERIDYDYSDNLVAVYFPFKNGHFYLQVNLTKAPDIKVDFVHTENANRVYFTATSENLTLEELAAGLKLEPLTGWSKGDDMKNGKAQFRFSRIIFQPFTSEACNLEQQLEKLLTELEKDSEGIRQLAQKANAYVSVCRHQYISGNAGIHFDINTIDRLARLNVSVDIDTYIVGNAIK